jgi:hypothetical protein
MAKRQGCALAGPPLQQILADREGFEPSIRLHVYTRSRRAPSTTRPSVRRAGYGGARPLRKDRLSLVEGRALAGNPFQVPLSSLGRRASRPTSIMGSSPRDAPVGGRPDSTYMTQGEPACRALWFAIYITPADSRFKLSAPPQLSRAGCARPVGRDLRCKSCLRPTSTARRLVQRLRLIPRSYCKAEGTGAS